MNSAKKVLVKKCFILLLYKIFLDAIQESKPVDTDKSELVDGQEDAKTTDKKNFKICITITVIVTFLLIGKTYRNL